MEANRKFWNEQQQALRLALGSPESFSQAIVLFLSQHAMLHAVEMSGAGLWSLNDEVCLDLSDAALRLIPRGSEHSIAWMLWHSARIEDVTMNRLVSGSPQLLTRDGWLDKLNVHAVDTGNSMDSSAVAALSAAIDLNALRAYRLAVGRRTREVVQALTPSDLKQKTDPARLQRVLDEGAVVQVAQEIIHYWGGLTVASLLLMPPTRHNFIHLNEALRLKQKIK